MQFKPKKLLQAMGAALSLTVWQAHAGIIGFGQTNTIQPWAAPIKGSHEFTPIIGQGDDDLAGMSAGITAGFSLTAGQGLDIAAGGCSGGNCGNNGGGYSGGNAGNKGGGGYWGGNAGNKGGGYSGGNAGNNSGGGYSGGNAGNKSGVNSAGGRYTGQ